MIYFVLGLRVDVSHEGVLALTPGTRNQVWNAYLRERREFFDWFDPTKVDLENRFISATGEAKVAAAKALIQFIIEAVARWDRLSSPTEGVWRGDIRTTISIRGAVRLEGEEEGRLTLELLPRAAGSSVAKARGEVDKGKSKFKISAGPLTPSGVSLLTGEMDSGFSGTVLGTAEANAAHVLFEKVLDEGELWTALMGTGLLGIAEFAGSRITTHLYLFESLHRYFELPGSPRVSSFDNRLSEPLDLNTLGWPLDFDPLDYLCDYFKAYVKTLDELRVQELQGTADLEARMHLARRTIQELVRALALGESAAADLACLEAAGLAVHDYDSRFDAWFKTYIEEGLAMWGERIASASGARKVDLLLDRFKFVLRRIVERDLTWDGLISELRLDELGLERQSRLVDSSYEDYYLAALSLWEGRVAADPGRLGEALAWLSQQVTWVVVWPWISDSLAGSLGLTSTPPAGRLTLEAAAGAP